MTNEEIRLELAKKAIESGTNIETAKLFYCWVVGEEKTENPKDVKISELADRLHRIGGTVNHQCSMYNIKTIGDLVKFGAHRFRKLPYIGGRTITMINELLEERYNIRDWYKT